MVNSCDTPRYTPPPPPEPPPISRAKHVGGGWQTLTFWCEGVRAPDHPGEDCGGFCWIGTFRWSWSWRRGKALAPCVPKQRRGDCGEEIVEARLLQRSWSLRPIWRPSSIFEMEVVSYESATKLKALELNQRKRREHRWRHAVAERVMVAAVRMARFFTDT